MVESIQNSDIKLREDGIRYQYKDTYTNASHTKREVILLDPEPIKKTAKQEYTELLNDSERLNYIAKKLGLI